MDVAAGYGALAAALVDSGHDVSCTSWDTNANLAVPIYRVNLDHEFSPGDVGGVRYPLVTAVEIIEHVENPSAFLRSCRTVLTDGGRLILTTPNVESAPARLQWLVRGCPLQFERQEVRNNRHISMMWHEGLAAITEASGLAIVERAFVGTPSTPGFRSLAKRALYKLMERSLQGDVRGTTRIYVLAPSAADTLSLGPGQVY